jgi:hypothetical protein
MPKSFAIHFRKETSMHISISGMIESDEPLTDERHEQIVNELVDWAEERGLYLTLVTKLEEDEEIAE